jgi:hypothetical protein
LIKLLVLVFNLYLTLTLSSRRGNTPLLLEEKGPGVEVILRRRSGRGMRYIYRYKGTPA